jgi:hypothetical protein
MNEIRLSASHYGELHRHLFRADRDEHGALLLAGFRSRATGEGVLTVREVHLLTPEEFPPGTHGYRQFSAPALARLGNRAADQNLALISVHSHPGSGSATGLSHDDLAAHERVFPHLLDITGAEVVGGVALGEDSAAGELWRSDGGRDQLQRLRVIGANTSFITPRPTRGVRGFDDRFDRQVRLFGSAGQERLRKLHVAVLGAGGGGSILCQSLAHLGVGEITVVDFDVVKRHNLSRIVGATSVDARRERKKIDVARRLIAAIDPSIVVHAIDGDIADESVAVRLLDCDFLFLATDTATGRLVANAMAQAFLIPLVQIGAKVDTRGSEEIEQIYTAVRPVLPRRGCLACAGLINPDQLQREATTEEERANQNYLDIPDEIDPSVITLNSAAAADALNMFLMHTMGLAYDELAEHRLNFPRDDSTLVVQTSSEPGCRWCGNVDASRYARADLALIPLRPHARQPAHRVRLGAVLRRMGGAKRGEKHP